MVGEKGLEGVSLIEVVRAAKEKGDKGLFNNSAQIWNHSFYWQCLAAPQGQRPTGRLAEMIDDAFGSTDQLLAKLKEEAVGHFSNGWAWLVLDRDSLKLTSLHDADTPIVYEGMRPLLTLAVWDHAYSLDYPNPRPEFVAQMPRHIQHVNFCW